MINLKYYLPKLVDGRVQRDQNTGSLDIFLKDKRDKGNVQVELSEKMRTNMLIKPEQDRENAGNLMISASF